MAKPRIEFLDQNHAPLDPGEKSVGIGLFDGAYERDFHAELGDLDIQSPILNEPSEARNFVSSDSRRFYVRVRDSRPQPVRVLPSGQRTIEARWYTRLPDGSVLDDNAGTSEITLVETSSGDYESPALMMVSWEEDRDLAPNAGIPGLYRPGTENRGYGASDHRLRRADMFGDMLIEYPASSGRELVECCAVAWPFLPNDRRILPLQLFVGSRRGVDQPVATPAQVFDISLHRARRVYESIGVSLETSPHPSAEARIAAGSRGIRKVIGGRGGRDCYYVVDAREFLAKSNLDAFSVFGIQALSASFPDLSQTVRVLYVGGFSPGANGLSLPPGDFRGDPARGSCACVAETRGDPSCPPTVMAIMAHEVGHILTDKSHRYGHMADQVTGYHRPDGGHFSRPALPADNRYINYYNLIGGTGFRLWDIDVTEFPDPPAPQVPRVFNQYRDIRRSIFVRPA